MTDTQLAWASLLVVGIGLAFWIRGVQKVALPANRALYVAAASVALLSGGAALLGSPGWVGGIAAVIAVVLSLFFLVTVAIGDQRVGDGAIQVGATIPEFTATDEYGETFDSQSLAGHPVLIKFFRAHW